MAEHEAAHAVVAWRLGVPVQVISIEQLADADHDVNGCCICDWESLRGSVDDTVLCTYAFAIAYAGPIFDMFALYVDFNTALERLPTDGDAAKYTRKRLSDWTELDERNTCAISKAGCDKAFEIVQGNQGLITALGSALVARRRMDSQEIKEFLVGYPCSE